MSRKYFGTDGVRGRVGQPPITPDFVMRLGYAAGKVLLGLAEMADGMGDALSSLSGESTIAYISPRALVLDEVEASISCWR